MLPTLLASEVRQGLKQFLKIGFEPSDPLFAGVMGRFTEDEAQWIKGPYLQIGLPFRIGTHGKNFFPGFETEHPGFVHQEKAWERLSSHRKAASTLVATGTGSGKTECFLYPLLDHCARARGAGQAGIKALVIYPMNALATDQARRFAQVIAATPRFHGLRVGLFVGGRTSTDGKGQTTMTSTEVITDRDTMRSDPPDILLTNYKMLDYLLIRPRDRQLWSRNKPETLRYVVVDELHTFDGAQGTDLALLLRRLKSRLGAPDHGLIYAGTSATLGGNADTAPLREYARQVFGTEFPEDSVITENRISDLEFLGDATIEHVLFPQPDFGALLAAEQFESPEEAIAAWYGLFFPGEEVLPSDVGNLPWRKVLGGQLKKHILFVNLLKLAKGRILSLAVLQELMKGPVPQNARAHIGPLLDALLALVAWARDPQGRPFVTLRIQVWVRELRRMVGTVSGRPEQIQLQPDSEVRHETGKLHLPLIQCTECHTTGWLSRMPSGQSVLSSNLEEIYNTWFAGQPEALRLYGSAGFSRPQCEGVKQQLCPSCGHLQTGQEKCIACANADLIEVFRVTATRTSTNRAGVVTTWHDATCPACGNRNTLILLGARNATLGSVVIEQTWASPFNDDKKLIAFSDSVQDAAHRAGFFTARTYQNTVRTGLARVIDHVARPTCSWTHFLQCAENLWLEEDSPLRLPPEHFVSEFIGPNMMWQRDWAEHLQQNGELPAESRLPSRVKKRLGWQAFAEFTYMSRRGRNLESIGKAVLTPNIESIRTAAIRVLPVLREQIEIRHVDERTVFQWLWGFVTHLKFRGAVTHPEMATYMGDGNVFAFSQTSGRKEWLPGMGPRSIQPRFLSLAGQEHLDRLVNPRNRTFYQVWLEASLGADGLIPQGADAETYGAAIEILEQLRVLTRVDGRAGAVVGLNAAELTLETRVARIVTQQGKRALTVPLDLADALLGMPCLQAPQESYSRKEVGESWFARQFSRGDLRRVFSAEHTGLLPRDRREALEQRFKAKSPHPWFENLLSATPTLEMGVDIGDLSSVLLCSVPPNQASYLQRIGRAGRRDGNAFTSTLADGASPHDLYFFEDTDEMLAGEVLPPGIFLKAPEVLRRQLFAYCLDHWVGSGVPDTALPDKTKEALDARDTADQTRFPYTFLAYQRENQDGLLETFKALLGPDLDQRMAVRLDGFMYGTDTDDALRMRLSKLLDELSKERASHRSRAEEIKKRVRSLKSGPQDEAILKEIEQLEREREKAKELIKEINTRDLLNTMTDAGLIPNYAFPEAGVELKSLLWRKKSSDDPQELGAYISLPAERYERPAQSALSEFAPENVFYANQRRVEVDQINLELSSLETWRLCPTCQHMRNLEIDADSDGACPKCGDPMWANISQKRQLLRFRQAIANSNDTEVRIDDGAEDREPKFFVRQMLADFDLADVREAYRLQSQDTPFGFEFIERVVFRDVNFGEPTKPGEVYSVAGQQRPRPGFRLCRHCGQVQRPPRNERERNQSQLHAFDCPHRTSEDPEVLIDCLYLYREFASEALRILVPFTRSGMDEISVQSFIAALQIGLKKRYGGKVDHLRMTTQEEQSSDGGPSRFYVLVYDSVPGGTGYLHELLADGAKTLVDLIHLALEHVRNCACNTHPEKDGCYRCVYQYSLGRSMAKVSRNRARAILEELQGNLDQLVPVKSITDIYVNPNFDSELEAKFVESLRRIGGNDGLPPVRLVQDIVQGKSGYLLEAGGNRYWVEPQVDLGRSEGVDPACRPDFVFWPAQSRSPRKPIAVFCDGWTFHRPLLRTDAAKRNALRATGKFWVWSVTWEDVMTSLEGKAESELHQSLPGMFISDIPQAVHDSADQTIWKLNAVAGLVRWLAAPIGVEVDSYVQTMIRNAGATVFRMVPHPSKPEGAQARFLLSQFWTEMDGLPCDQPAQAVPAGNVNESLLTLRYFLSAALLNRSLPPPASPGFITLDEGAAESATLLHLGWRRWLWLYNCFQTLPGVLLATKSGLAGRDWNAVRLGARSASASGGNQQAHAEGWGEVIASAVGTLSSGLEALRDWGLPMPDEVGLELADGTDVIAECELAWTSVKLVLLMQHHLHSEPAWAGHGWTTIADDEGWPQRIREFLNGVSGAQ